MQEKQAGVSSFGRVEIFGAQVERLPCVSEERSSRMARGTLPMETESLEIPTVQFRKSTLDSAKKTTLKSSSGVSGMRNTMLGMNTPLQLVGTKTQNVHREILGRVESKVAGKQVSNHCIGSMEDELEFEEELELKIEIDDAHFFDLALEAEDGQTPLLEGTVPDMIFTPEINPFSCRAEVLPLPKPKSRTLIPADLWTIVLGTLVLSIGAQYILHGIGLASL